MPNPGALSPRDESPPLGLRSCQLCRWFEGLRRWNDGTMAARCSVMGFRDQPEAGCVRFVFDVEMLGEEGADAA